MRAVSQRAYARAPEGCYVVIEGALVFCAAADLYGTIAWGRHGGPSVDKLCAVLDVELTAPRHDSVFDLRRVSQVDPDGFERMKRYLVDHAARHAKLVRRQVLLRPAGFVGAVVSGFFEVMAPQYPVHVADTPEEAAAWLARPEVVSLLAGLERAVTGGPTRAAVRALLISEPDLRLTVAAQRLGLSERTLQRRLDDEGSSYGDEAQAVRIERAQVLLSTTDEKITEIARLVGCATPQSFASLFRRMTGATPTEWRARHRR